jgi:HD-GYP domain-containing protein (c-di-GMP phosphodiesterase class II)
MGLAFRTFLCLFVPLILFLAGGFVAVERAVGSIVHNGLRSVLRDSHSALTVVQLRNEHQSKRYLRVVGENAALKAGLQLLLSNPKSTDARLTVEDQLREIASTSNIDLLFLASADGLPLVGVIRTGDEILPLRGAAIPRPESEFYFCGGTTYQITSVRIDQADASIAWLSVGEAFDFKAFNAPVVLLHRGKVIESNLPGVSGVDLNRRLSHCRPDVDCEITLADETSLYVAASTHLSSEYSVRSFANIDSALKPVQSTIRHLFLVAGALALVLAVIFTTLSSRVTVEPIRRLVRSLRESESTGTLNSFDESIAVTAEIRELVVGFNRAAGAIRDSQHQLHATYLECVQSLASALDARDQYTAGHSGRVSSFSCMIAEAMAFSSEALRELGVGALLHDIGKIGIPDAVLQKPGKLTVDEFDLISQHPSIGRRILEAVHGFAPYMDVVELHHENWDGTGYPHGLREQQVPIGARIVHVADAYDAMTSDRPYRPGMDPEKALGILQANAGTQFDPTVVELFTTLWRHGRIERVQAGWRKSYQDSLRSLAEALRQNEPLHVPYEKTEVSAA